MLAEGEIIVCAQNNNNTKQFVISNRVLFGGQAFKIESVKNFLNDTTFGNNDNPLIFWKMKRVDLSALDDVANNIADNSEYEYTLEINQAAFNQVVGYSSTLSAVVKRNGEAVSEGVTWSSSDATKVSVNSSGVVSLLALGSATITCAMTDNADVNDTILITVVAATTPVDDTRILPDATYLYQGDPAQVYTVYKFENDVQQADTFTISTSGVATSKYECIAISGNSFSVRVIEKDDDNALVVTCTNDVDATTKTLQITLRGMW